MIFRIDRKRVLDSYGPEQLRRFFLLAPEFEKLAFQPVPREFRNSSLLTGRAKTPISTMHELAELTEFGSGISALAAGLNSDALRLAILAGWHGGNLRKSEALREMSGWSLAHIAESPADDLIRVCEERFATATEHLQLLLLGHLETLPDGTELLRVPSDVTAVVRVPGVRLKDRVNEILTDDLGRWIRANGRTSTGTRKDERLLELQELFVNQAHLANVTAQLTAPAREIFDTLLRNIHPMHLESFGAGFGSRLPVQHRRYPGAQVFGELDDLGLIGFDAYRREIWVWQEIAKASGTRVFQNWFYAPKPVLSPLASNGKSEAFNAIAAVASVQRFWTRSLPPALADGSIGVAPIKAAAKALRLHVGVVGLATHLLVNAGAMKPTISGATGRGRNRVPTFAWEMGPVVSIADSADMPSATWQSIVGEWLRAASLNESEGLPTRFGLNACITGYDERQLVLRVLESLPVGEGALDLDGLAAWVANVHHFMLPLDIVRGVLQGATAVGLLTASAPFGLTDCARDLLNGRPVELVNGVGGASLIVQSDLTIVVPPDTDLGVVAKVRRFAILESDAGAMIFRITEQLVGEAIDDGMTVDEVVELLVSCSNVGIPQPVEYFLRDVERRHGRITVASAVTVIASPDSALLVQASRVKGTGLQLIGANTAISEVPAAKVQQLLAAKGLLPIFYAPIPPADVSLSSKSSKPSGRASTKSAEDTTLKYSPLSVTLSRANSLLRT